MIKRYSKILIPIIFIVFISGCASNLYIWNNYSKSKYIMKKKETDEAIRSHKESLISIIDKSELSGKKVPPGIYSELGQIYQREGEVKSAIECFENEKYLYPESIKFIDLIISQIQEKKDIHSTETGNE